MGKVLQKSDTWWDGLEVNKVDMKVEQILNRW
jgi:hypothetical protein